MDNVSLKARLIETVMDEVIQKEVTQLHKRDQKSIEFGYVIQVFSRRNTVNHAEDRASKRF